MLQWYLGHMTGVTITSHPHNPNVIIRTGTGVMDGSRFEGMNMLIVAVSNAPTLAEKYTDLKAEVVLAKSWKNAKSIPNWFAEIKRVNSLSLKDLERAVKPAELHLASCKKHKSRLFQKNPTLFTLIGPLRENGCRRLHSYRGDLINGKLRHSREPATMPMAFTLKEALHMVKYSLEHPKD